VVALVYEPDNTVIATLWTYGRLEIDFEYLMKNAAFASDAKREELRQRLAAGTTLNIPEDRIGKRPSILWSELTDANSMRTVLDSIGWVVDEISRRKLDS
jgi:hypothetical protein